MPIYTIRHVTTYRYKRAVAFGEHRMMLRPRDDGDQIVLDAGLAITPRPADVTWTRDAFDNHMAIARFASRARELRFESVVRLDHAPAGLNEAHIADFARDYPFAYAAQERPGLVRFLSPLSPDPRLARWAAGFLREDGTADTGALLADMTRTIRRTFKHTARHEKGVQDPILTLKLATGSCRDLAVLMIAALRSLRIAARFVSGYLHLPNDDEDDDPRGGNTHAWVQAYLPGAGWVDFDPSGGTVGNHCLIRVAVAHEPSEAIPLQGTFFGSAADHVGMSVAVKVTSTNGNSPISSLRAAE
jgi:transglutaminase-like putative cysteine protease